MGFSIGTSHKHADAKYLTKVIGRRNNTVLEQYSSDTKAEAESMFRYLAIRRDPDMFDIVSDPELEI